MRIRSIVGSLFAVTYSPDGKSLASGSQDGTIKLWKPVAQGTVAMITNVVVDEWHWVGHPVGSPDGKIMATASRDDEIQLWDIAACRIGIRLKTADLPVAFSPDGQDLLTRDHHFGSLQLWDISTQTPSAATPLSSVAGNYYADAFSPDRKIIATAQRDRRIVLRSAITGGLLFTLPDPALSRSLKFSADSQS